MSKTIGTNRPENEKSCRNCGEPFEWPEFSSYMMRLSSGTIDCIRCQTENYTVPRRDAMYFLVLLFSCFSAIAFLRRRPSGPC